MPPILILALLLCSIPSFAQKEFGKTKSELNRFLKQETALRNRQGPTIQTSDTSLTLTITESGGRTTRFTYSFSRRTGRCIAKRTESECDSCYRNYLYSLLQNKSYGWKQINENQYVSAFAAKLMLELPAEEGPLSFFLYYNNWSKAFYELLVRP
ncbi:MAG: hypothetical protein RJA57_1059 [Bacteroidota bacterium]|jgi:hypothetical protein